MHVFEKPTPLIAVANVREIWATVPVNLFNWTWAKNVLLHARGEKGECGINSRIKFVAIDLRPLARATRIGSCFCQALRGAPGGNALAVEVTATTVAGTIGSSGEL
jgi:hypothetical protein